MTDLTPAQLQELRRDLLELQDEIDRILVLTREGVRPVDLEEPIGRLTRMDALQLQSLARANRSSLEVRKKQVRAALAAMESGGAYGLCRRCEETIAFRRLKARPETPFCVHCQESLESRL